MKKIEKQLTSCSLLKSSLKIIATLFNENTLFILEL